MSSYTDYKEYFDKGNKYFDEQKYNDASINYEKCLELNPDYIYAQYNLGLCYFNLNNITKAISLYEKAIKNSPEYKLPIIELARIYTDKRDFAKAEKYLKRGMEIDSNDHVLLHTLGLFHFRQDNFKKAKELFLRVIELKPDYHWAYYNTGLCYEREKDIRSAITYQKKALTVEKGYQKAKDQLATLIVNNDISFEKPYHKHDTQEINYRDTNLIKLNILFTILFSLFGAGLIISLIVKANPAIPITLGVITLANIILSGFLLHFLLKQRMKTYRQSQRNRFLKIAEKKNGKLTVYDIIKDMPIDYDNIYNMFTEMEINGLGKLLYDEEGNVYFQVHGV